MTNLPTTPSNNSQPMIGLEMLPMDWDFGLVIVSYLCSVQAAYSALLILQMRIRVWLVAVAALCLSVSGIWSMHFIGMAAMAVHAHVTYDLGWTIVSILFAFFPTFGAFWTLDYVMVQRSRKLKEKRTLLLADVRGSRGEVDCNSPLMPKKKKKSHSRLNPIHQRINGATERGEAFASSNALLSSPTSTGGGGGGGGGRGEERGPLHHHDNSVHEIKGVEGLICPRDSLPSPRVVPSRCGAVTTLMRTESNRSSHRLLRSSNGKHCSDDLGGGIAAAEDNDDSSVTTIRVNSSIIMNSAGTGKSAVAVSSGVKGALPPSLAVPKPPRGAVSQQHPNLLDFSIDDSTDHYLNNSHEGEGRHSHHPARNDNNHQQHEHHNTSVADDDQLAPNTVTGGFANAVSPSSSAADILAGLALPTRIHHHNQVRSNNNDNNDQNSSIASMAVVFVADAGRFVADANDDASNNLDPNNNSMPLVVFHPKWPAGPNGSSGASAPLLPPAEDTANSALLNEEGENKATSANNLSSKKAAAAILPIASSTRRYGATGNALDISTSATAAPGGGEPKSVSMLSLAARPDTSEDLSTPFGGDSSYPTAAASKSRTTTRTIVVAQGGRTRKFEGIVEGGDSASDEDEKQERLLDDTRDISLQAHIRALERAPHGMLLLGGAMIALGACLMHYLGMHAMSMEGMQRSIDAGVVFASVLIALFAGTAALYFAFVLPLSREYTLPTALVAGAAVSGMHYVGMYGIRYSQSIDYYPSYNIVNGSVLQYFFDPLTNSTAALWVLLNESALNETNRLQHDLRTSGGSSTSLSPFVMYIIFASVGVSSTSLALCSHFYRMSLREAADDAERRAKLIMAGKFDTLGEMEAAKKKGGQSYRKLDPVMSRLSTSNQKIGEQMLKLRSFLPPSLLAQYEAIEATMAKHGDTSGLDEDDDDEGTLSIQGTQTGTHTGTGTGTGFDRSTRGHPSSPGMGGMEGSVRSEAISMGTPGTQALYQEASATSDNNNNNHHQLHRTTMQPFHLTSAVLQLGSGNVTPTTGALALNFGQSPVVTAANNVSITAVEGSGNNEAPRPQGLIAPTAASRPTPIEHSLHIAGSSCASDAHQHSRNHDREQQQQRHANFADNSGRGANNEGGRKGRGGGVIPRGKTIKKVYTLPTGIEMRNVAVLSINCHGFARVMTDYAAQFMSLYTHFMDGLCAVAKTQRGLMDIVHGDRVIITFNAALKNAAPGKACALAAVQIAQDVGAPGVCGCVAIGVASGQAKVGNMGPGQMIKYNVCGPVVPLAVLAQEHAYELHRKHGVHIAGFVSDEMKAVVRHRSIDIVQWRHMPRPGILSEITHAIPSQDDKGQAAVGGDWMYEHEMERKDHFQHINKAFALALEVENRRRRIREKDGIAAVPPTTHHGGTSGVKPHVPTFQGDVRNRVAGGNKEPSTSVPATINPSSPFLVTAHCNGLPIAPLLCCNCSSTAKRTLAEMNAYADEVLLQHS